MHAASKHKFMSCFLNKPDLQQVHKGVQSPWDIILYFNLLLAVMKSRPQLEFRVATSIEFVQATSHGTNPHTQCPFYLLLTHVPCTYQDIQMSHCCQVRRNY